MSDDGRLTSPASSELVASDIHPGTRTRRAPTGRGRGGQKDSQVSPQLSALELHNRGRGKSPQSPPLLNPGMHMPGGGAPSQPWSTYTVGRQQQRRGDKPATPVAFEDRRERTAAVGAGAEGPVPGVFVNVPGGVAAGTEQPTAPEPKPVTVYRVLNSYKALLKLSDGPPKLTPDNFLSWQSSFLTYFRHSVRSSIYDSRESEIKYAPPNCENDPRVEVDQYGLDFVEQLSMPEYSQFHPSGQTTTDDVVFLHGVLSALLTRAIVDNKEAAAIVTSMLASGGPEGAWRAYQTLASKYLNSGVHKVWEALDRLYGPAAVGSTGADRQAQHAAAWTELVNASGSDDDANLASYVYTLHYLPKIASGFSADANRIRSRCVLEGKSLNELNYLAIEAALDAEAKAGVAHAHLVQPLDSPGGLHQANFVRQPGRGERRPVQHDRPRPCNNCNKAGHRAVACPEPCKLCDCSTQVDANGCKLAGHYPDCRRLTAGDSFAKLVTVHKPRASPAGPPRRDPPSVNRERQHERGKTVQHIVNLTREFEAAKDDRTKDVLERAIRECETRLSQLTVADNLELANMVAASNVSATSVPFSVDGLGYETDDSIDGAKSLGSAAPAPAPDSPSAAVGTAQRPTGPSVFVSRPRKPGRTIPAILTAAAFALMAGFGGSVPQLVPGSYAVKRLPGMQSAGDAPPPPPPGMKWKSVVVDSGASISLFDDAEKFSALHPSRTYVQTADKSQRLFDQRGTVVLPATEGEADRALRVL